MLSTTSFEVGKIYLFFMCTYECIFALVIRDGHDRAVSFYFSHAFCIFTFLRSIIREATSKSKDGRIDQSDFLNHCAATTRYALFTPMEAQIIFHFAARGDSSRRLALIDFAQLLDPRWQAPARGAGNTPIEASTTMNIVHEIAHSIYNFGLGGKG